MKHQRLPGLLAAALVLGMAAAAPARAAAIRVRPSPQEGALEVRVEPFRPFAAGVLELIDPATGRVLRAVRAGALSSRDVVTLQVGAALPPGSYTLRYREGLSIVATGQEIRRPDAQGRRWNSPTDMLFTADAIYVLDGVVPMLANKVEHLTPRDWSPLSGEPVRGRFVRLDEDGTLHLARTEGDAVVLRLDELADADRRLAEQMERERLAYAAMVADNVPTLYRLTRDGRADEGFGDGGRIRLPQDRFVDIGGFAVDAQGHAYFSDTYHSALVFDAAGQRLRQRVGGWDNDPFGPRCTGWVNGLVAGPGNRLYIPTGYGNLKVYDHSQHGFEGALYFLAGLQRGYDRNVAIDVVASRGPEPTPQTPTTLYFVGSDNSITRLEDDGSELRLVHASAAPAKLARLTGPWASAGLVWVADYGPSPGPFWDSGGGGEVLLLWDDGQSCRLVGRFGQPGPTPGEPETPDLPRFMNPAAIYMTPDHATLWIAEGGQRYTEGPPGNARIRQFHLLAARSEEASIELPAK